MQSPLNRREWLAGSGMSVAATAAGLVGAPESLRAQADANKAQPAATPAEPFGFCLNTGTIRGHELNVATQVEHVADAGYKGIEPWVREIDKYVKEGGSLKDLGKRIKDRGLVVPSAIAFAEWVVDDDQRRKQGLEQAKRDMDMVLQIGGTRIAAPPAGATNEAGLDLLKAAERYRALLELGESMGVTPELELWGFSKNLSRLGETAFVAVESGHPRACILPDIYHLYKGGSGFGGLHLLSQASMYVLHMNDYPADPPRTAITDASRVFPGDGIAPLADVLRSLRDLGFRGMLSLEVFNRDYWKQDVDLVLRMGLEKMRAVVAKALA